MTKKSVILLLLLIPFLCFSQKKEDIKTNIIKINIDSIGEIKDGMPLNFTKHDTINISDKSFNSKITNQVRDTLLSKVQRAIDNIQNDSLYLHSLYNYLWPTDSGKIIKELNAFKSFLENNYTIPPGTTDDYIPDLNDLKKQVFDNSTIASPFSYIAKKDDDNLKVNIIYTDPFQHWFTGWYNDLLKKGNLYDEEMDYDYKKGWRQLEQWYQTGKFDLAKIDSVNKTFYDCTEDEDSLDNNINSLLTEININDNYIVKLLRNNKEFKKWLWLTEGFVQINPLTATSISRHYPSAEHISFPDTSIKAGFNNQAEFKLIQTDRRIANAMVIPYADDNDKHRPYLIQYNATNNYSIINKSAFKASDASKRLSYKDNYIVSVNNLPVDKNVSFSQTEKDLVNEGYVIQQLNGFGDSLSSFAKLIPQTIGTATWNVLGGILNTQKTILPNSNINPNIGAVVKDAKQNLQIRITKNFIKSNLFSIVMGKINLDSTTSSKDLKMITKSYNEGKFYFKINDRKVPSSGSSNNDKKAILHAAQLQDETGDCNLCKTYINSPLIDTFLNRDLCYEFNYDKRKTLQASADRLNERFQCFIHGYNVCHTNLTTSAQLLKARLSILNSLIRINKRSLPPRQLEEFTNESPLFRTVNHQIDIPQSDKTVGYGIVESSLKSPGANDSIKNTVATNSIKIAKRFYFDFSVGFAFTTKDFFLKTQTADSLPVVSQADRFKLIAGVNIYPFHGGLDKLDNRLGIGGLDRLSFFLGVSIPKAFDNLYAGLSYDFVPGIRTIAGCHFYKDTRYTILNNQVVDKASGYRASGIFISLALEPVTLLKYLLLIK